MISEILPECSQIIHLNLTECYFGCKQDEILHFVNNIWNLPKLINCYLNLSLKYGSYFPIPTNISLSIEHLSIVGISYKISELIDLYEHTPHLRYLAFDLSHIHRADDKELQRPILSITELNFSFGGTRTDIIENLLQHMPNLYKLKIETCYLEMNGNK
jgi:hypothetical protein